jgi:hypothetical protein
MPIYEYYCPDNHTVYRFFARRAGLDKKVPRCPADPKFQMEKRVSSFAIVGATYKAKKDQPEGGDGPDLDDPRMERAMMEMEGEMSAMDDENPDPRQLGRMMRRMSELTGEKGDARTEEMIRRLESGEDPEKMEEEFGDLSDEGDGAGDDAESGGGEEKEGLTTADRLMARIRRARRRMEPRLDPELYEMEEFIGKKRQSSGEDASAHRA